MRKRVRRISGLRRPRRPNQPHRPIQQQVHFHQGPHGEAVPCYERHCSLPHMAVYGYDGVGTHTL